MTNITQLQMKIYGLIDEIHSAMYDYTYSQRETLRSRILDLQEFAFTLKAWEEEKEEWDHFGDLGSPGT